MKQSNQKVLVVGAGLAGVEVAYYLASRGVEVILAECKALQLGPAQKLATFGELVCSNSLKSLDLSTGHGILKREMEHMSSLVLATAYAHRVPAGSALAVERVGFSHALTLALENHPLIRIINSEIVDPWAARAQWQADYVVVATGPLTTAPLSQWIRDNISQEDFYFYDAIAPVVDGDTIDRSYFYRMDRHGEVGQGDYLNLPLNREQYEHFILLLQQGEKVPAREFEDYQFFESCLPIDLMAERGVDTARFSCLRPIGLEPSKGKRPHAVIQLRQENLLGNAYNLVGFQTRLTYKEQIRIFRTLPGMGNAEFLHLGQVHRNSFLNAKKLLNRDLSLITDSHTFFAGQITGVEGYTESASMGLYVGAQIWHRLRGDSGTLCFPVETAIGALVNYLMTVPKPTPSNINLGLFPPVEQLRGRKNRAAKREIIAQRAGQAWEQFAPKLVDKVTLFLNNH